MRVTVLGCGGSGGVPQIGGVWGKANPQNPKNYRTRPSILIEDANTTIVIDTTADVRTQLLRENVNRINAIIYTHAHADHTNGFDDIRYINQMMQVPIPIFANLETTEELRQRFAYAFLPKGDDEFYRPNVKVNVISGPFKIGDFYIQPFDQDHGYSASLGFRIGNFAYSTDVKNLSAEAMQALTGVEYWIVDALRDEPHPTHAHLAMTLDWVKQINPRKAYLTHMNHMVDYDDWQKRTPDNVEPAYDGLVFEV